MQCMRENHAMRNGLTSLPAAEEAALFQQIEAEEYSQMQAVSCGRGNAGGICIVTNLSFKIQVSLDQPCCPGTPRRLTMHYAFAVKCSNPVLIRMHCYPAPRLSVVANCTPMRSSSRAKLLLLKSNACQANTRSICATFSPMC